MSEYTDALKQGMQRVNDLTNDYETALRAKDHAMAAVVRGQLSAARAYLQGLTDAGEIRLKDTLAETFKVEENDDEQ